VTIINLNIFPLGSYDMTIGMDWLEKYKVVLNCFDKTFTYVAEDQIVRNIGGISKHVSLRYISSMKLKKCMRKGYEIYVVQAIEPILNEQQAYVKYYLVLSEFMDVFLEEVPVLPPK